MGEERKFSSVWHESSVVVKPTDPQLRLYQAVFVEAIRDYAAAGDDAGMRDGDDVGMTPDWEKAAERKQLAENFIFDGDETPNWKQSGGAPTEHDPGSFPWYCRRLNLNPEKTKTRLREPTIISELRGIVRARVRVDELVIRLLKDGILPPRPTVKPLKKKNKNLLPLPTDDGDM